MKKRLITFMAVAVLLIASVIPASAAVFTDSAENKVAPTVTVLTATIGDYEVQASDVTVYSMSDYSSDDFDAAIAAVEAATDVEDLVGSTGMLSPAVSCLYYVVISDDLQEALDANEDEALEIKLSNAGITSGATVLAYAYNSGDWDSVSATNNSGAVTLTDAFGAIMLVVDTAVVESPETSQEISMLAIVSVVSFLFAGAFFAMSRKSRLFN